MAQQPTPDQRYRTVTVGERISRPDRPHPENDKHPRAGKILNRFRETQPLTYAHGISIPVIDQLFRVARYERPARRLRRLVSGVGGSRCITFLERRGHAAAIDASSPTAIADCLELAVPIGGGQPYLHLDMRVGGRRKHRGHAAVRRHDAGRCLCGTAGAGKSGRHQFRRGDGGIGERQNLETLTGVLGGRRLSGTGGRHPKQ